MKIGVNQILAIVLLVITARYARAFMRLSALTSSTMKMRLKPEPLFMSLGVPKVAYKLPGGRHGEWVNIFQRLNRERIIFISSEIDDELANQVIGVLLYLDNENPSLPIYLYINSPGGSVVSGLAIHDTMQHVQSEIVTVNLGMAASMASFLLCAGSKGRRYALPHSRVMVHQPMGGAQGQAEDIRIEATHILRMKNNVVKMYSLMTGQSMEKVTADIERDNYMSAEEAMQYGLIDAIVPPNEDKRKALLQLPPRRVAQITGAQLSEETDGYQFGKMDVPKYRPPR